MKRYQFAEHKKPGCHLQMDAKSSLDPSNAERVELENHFPMVSTSVEIRYDVSSFV